MLDYSVDTLFWLFCMGVPMFMAFNGGATAATVDTIQEEGDWSQTGIGLLGAMDKIGMTVSAAFWGYVLQKMPAKYLLCLGLAVNASSVMIFATLKNCYSMYSAKLLVGLTEGLQWVWAPLWIAKNADEATLPLWMNLSGGVSSGVGSGLGTLLAGFTTAHGLSYSFAFQLESCVLFVLLAALLLTKLDSIALSSMTGDKDAKVEMLESASRIRSISDASELAASLATPRSRPRSGSFMEPIMTQDDKPLSQQLSMLWENRLFCRSALAFASSNYVNAGLAFIWIRTFIDLWEMDKQISVVSFLVITGAGGATGISLSSNVEGGADAQRTLSFLQKALAASSVGAIVTMAGLFLQLLRGTHAGYLFLVPTWGGIYLLCAGIGCTTGLIQIVCNGSVEDEKVRSFGTGISQGINNFLGFAMGPLLPQMIMDLVMTYFSFDESQALVAGFVSVLAGTFLTALCIALAHRVANSPAGGLWLPVIAEDPERERSASGSPTTLSSQQGLLSQQGL